MSTVTLTLDGHSVCAREGETLLSVIRERGVPLPTLCHVDGLSARGGCRLCLVEVDGMRRPQPACLTGAREGMIVRTDTARLRRNRRTILELLLAERRHACGACVMNRRCELQDAAASVGLDPIAYESGPPARPLDATHPRFVRDPDRCILCGRCRRACEEIEKACTIDFMGRGAKSEIGFDLDRPWGESRSCTGCGQCVRLCPTGALYDRGPSAEGER